MCFPYSSLRFHDYFSCVFYDFLFLHCILSHRKEWCAPISHREETMITQEELETPGPVMTQASPFYCKIVNILAPIAEDTCMLELTSVASERGGCHEFLGPRAWVGGGARDPGTTHGHCLDRNANPVIMHESPKQCFTRLVSILDL